MFGDNMLVAPVLYEGEREKLVYLPEGTWYNYFTHERFEGGKYYSLEVELDETAVFVREGSIIPVYDEYYDYVGEKELDITLEVFRGTGKLEFYEDDGISFEYKDGKYNLYQIESLGNEERSVTIKTLHNGLGKERTFKLRYI
jgi:alpha-glucosidase